MPDTPQWLIFLASQQDYGWFLGVVLWGVVAGAAVRLPKVPRNIRSPLVWLGGGLTLYCLVELAATAWPEKPPHQWLDALLGVIFILGYAGQVWPKFIPTAGRLNRVIALGVPILGAAILRVWDPLYAGLLWTLLGALACVGAASAVAQDLSGGKARALFWTKAAALLGALVVTPLGPLAYSLLSGRNEVDLNPLAVPHLLALLGAAVAALALLWCESIAGRKEWQQALRTAWWSLAVWLAAGFVLILWSGARVRQQHNVRIGRQAENAAALIDRVALRQCLAPEFKLGRLHTFYQPGVGWEVVFSHIPYAKSPPFLRLSEQLHEIELVNPDADFIHILALRGGQRVAAATHLADISDSYLVGLRGEATGEDLAMLQSHETRVIGPMASSWGTIVSVRVPLFEAGAKYAPAWLVIQYRVAVWQAQQAADRFVIIALVALGIVLWGLAVAYRLRNFEREAALREAGAAAEADRVKTMFLAKVSHELRTPLQTILGNAELSLQTALEPVVRARIAAISSQGTLLQRLVNDLLDLSAIQTGRFQLRSAPFELQPVIRECLAAVAGPAREKGISLGETWPAGLPPPLLGDAQRIRQILMNLLSNAVKYTTRGTVELAVETRRTPGELWAVKLEVRDTGPGISPGDQIRIFEPFTRLEQHRHLAEGTGLGLSLVAGLVRAMGGTIQIESDGVSGTRVWCELLLPAGGTTEEKIPPTFQPARVLVADDNTLVRELLASSLTAAGFTITTVPDGEAALAAFEATPFDAVVLDISMPRLDGIETARAIRRRKPAASGPWLIGLSAHAQEADIALAKVAGMDRFLVKPVELAVLNEVLAEGLGRSGLAGRTRSEAVPAGDLARRFRITFDAEWPALGARLRTAIVHEDWNGFRQAVHYLKNSADVLGLDTLRLACMEAEHGASLEDVRQIGPIWLRIEKIVAQYRADQPTLAAVIPTAASNPTR